VKELGSTDFVIKYIKNKNNNLLSFPGTLHWQEIYWQETLYCRQEHRLLQQPP
jgi:hypothetical protein